MNWKEFFIAWGVLFVLVTGIGFVIHGVLLQADYAALVERGMMRPEDEGAANMPFIFIANIFFSLAFVLIYSRGVEDKPWVGQGLRFGGLVALLWAVPIFLIDYAVQPLPGSLVGKQIAYEAVDMLILGLAAAAIYRR